MHNKLLSFEKQKLDSGINSTLGGIGRYIIITYFVKCFNIFILYIYIFYNFMLWRLFCGDLFCGDFLDMKRYVYTIYTSFLFSTSIV